ncbi:DUF4365 domain-containing protein [Collinsella sp. AGMB00827]|uniref:DUF4365 domain-containing protein n=1 Tax=Collinsella ureilytica TaxID=2869515 RepID=A0ABS7MHY9_9ACTN|nr:DUF4365 domain-containing protein [Collinsella urealyticum]MBY4796954.1 DUF4365 domain-containing protein [Collinsella urealyticum]
MLANTGDAGKDTVVASTKNQDLGRAGESAVLSFFNSRRFAAYSYPQELDLGADIEIDLREVDPDTGNAKDLGFPIRCQIKTGSSYFNQKGVLDGQEGWWLPFDIKHYNYWTTHKNKFFLILQTSDMQLRYWQWLDCENRYQAVIQSSDNGIEKVVGYKLFVPRKNIVDDDFCEYLLRIAHEDRLAAQLSTSSDVYRFDISEYETSRWARYALMLPDLTKPHVNRGFDHAITWAEALALCVCQDQIRWDIPESGIPSFSEEYDDVPSIRDAQTSEEAGWRFAAAYYSHRFKNSANSFSEISDLTDNLLVAKTVITSADLFCERKFEEAIVLIDAQIESLPTMDDVDKAWLLMHKGNCLYELARWDEARASYGRCKSLTNERADSDQTAQILQDNATSALFHMESPFNRNFGSVIAGYDCALSRFSLRRNGMALRDFLECDFRNWGLGENRTIATSDTMKINLEISCNIGLLSGDVPSYRSALSSIAIINLVAYDPNTREIVKDLTAMVDAGDAEHLRQSVNRVVEEKSPNAPYTFINAIKPSRVTPSTVRPIFTALMACGDYLADEGTSHWFNFLKGLLENPEDFLLKFSKPNSFYRWPDEAIKCLYTMRYQLTSQQLIWFSDFICTCPYDLQIVSYQVQGILALSMGLPECSQRLEERFENLDTSNWLHSILKFLLYREDEVSRETIHRELISGDITNINKIGINGLHEDETDAILKLALGELHQIAEQSKNGSYHHRAIDYGRLAGMVFFRDADASKWWDMIVTFLETPLIGNREKISLSKMILNNLSRVSVDMAKRLIKRENAILSSILNEDLMLSSNKKEQEILSDLIDSMKGISIGFENVVAEKLARNEKLGLSKIKLLTYSKNWDLLLLGLCLDGNVEHAREAFASFVIACCADEEKYSQYKSCIANCCMHKGKCFPRTFLDATFKINNRSEDTKEILRILSGHESAQIRFHAKFRLRAFGES